MEEDLPTLIAKQDHLSILRHIRAHKLREPNLVIHHGLQLLGTDLNRKNLLLFSLDESERLSVLEQICIAALDVHNLTLAEKCLFEIRRSDAVSSDSVRVRRLEGMKFESSGDYVSAEELYDDLLKQNPANGFALKRKYCILRAQIGKETEAKEAFNQYLDANQGDTSAWMEMYRLCMDSGDYKGATYCLEEVVLANPLDATLHCLLGELYVTLGGLSNLKLARKHMAQSLELNPNYLRALFGLLSAAGGFLEECGVSKKKKEVVELEEDLEVAKELMRFGTDKILGFYKGSPMYDVVEKVVRKETNAS